jgi:hypothetical protein
LVPEHLLGVEHAAARDLFLGDELPESGFVPVVEPGAIELFSERP